MSPNLPAQDLHCTGCEKKTSLTCSGCGYPCCSICEVDDSELCEPCYEGANLDDKDDDPIIAKFKR